MNEKLKDYAKKMYINLDSEEEKAALEGLKFIDESFKEISQEFSKLSETEPMTHTIEIDDVQLREDIPVETPPIEELLKNATNVNGREIEVPKVVG